MSDWTIRRAQRADRPDLASLMRAALDGLGFVPRLHTPGEDSAFMAGLLLSADVWVAVADRPVGFIAIVKGGMVPALYVEPDWQAKGIGAALLSAARTGCQRLELKCFQQNLVARRFYEGRGFRAVSFDAEGHNDEGLPDVTYVWEGPSDAFAKGAAWIDGEIVPIGEAKIGVTDWGVTRSDITYDVASVWEGGFFRLDDYIERFMASIRACRLTIDPDPDEIRHICHAMVARTGLRAAYVAMVASRGQPVVQGNRDPRTCANHFYAWAVPYIHVVQPHVAEAGASLWIAKSVRRIPEDSVNPRAKNYHWGDMTSGLLEAKDNGYETVALLDHAGNVTEGPGFNVFAVKNDRVVTSDHGVLHGITRRTVLEMCSEAGLATESRALPLTELMESDEVFLSTTGGGVVPVARVDQRTFSNGAPGPVASALRGLYAEWRLRPQYRQEISYAAS